MKNSQKIERKGWLNLAEKSMEKIWNNKKDDEVWIEHLWGYISFLLINFA